MYSFLQKGEGSATPFSPFPGPYQTREERKKEAGRLVLLLWKERRGDKHAVLFRLEVA